MKLKLISTLLLSALFLIGCNSENSNLNALLKGSITYDKFCQENNLTCEKKSPSDFYPSIEEFQSILKIVTALGEHGSNGISFGRDDLTDSNLVSAINTLGLQEDFGKMKEYADLTDLSQIVIDRGIITLNHDSVSSLSNPLLADERNLPIPQTALPFNARLYFEKGDGRQVTIFNDGTVSASYPITQSQTISNSEQIIELAPQIIQSSIPPGEIEPLIVPLLASDVIPRGVTTSISQEQTNFEEIILIRGEDGVYEFAWSDEVGQELLPGVQILDLLLERLKPEPEN